MERYNLTIWIYSWGGAQISGKYDVTITGVAFKVIKEE